MRDVCRGRCSLGVAPSDASRFPEHSRDRCAQVLRSQRGSSMCAIGTRSATSRLGTWREPTRARALLESLTFLALRRSDCRRVGAAGGGFQIFLDGRAGEMLEFNSGASVCHRVS